MKIAITGAGVVGLTLAHELLSADKSFSIDLFDSFSIPSKGTSIRNSGVLHAGLYYKPGSLKSQLCLQGRELLQDFISQHNLDILSCGKLLIPHSQTDLGRLTDIKVNADKNGCVTYLVEHPDALSIQPGICERDCYLWSPKTSVFSPTQIINQLAHNLRLSGRVNFVITAVESLDADKTQLTDKSGHHYQYDYIFNVAGPGALDLYKSVSDSFNHLLLVPFIGEYARLNQGLPIKTNLYPVPDPELPFLGVHITPQLQGSNPIIGPNALPFPRSYFNEYLSSDFTKLGPRLSFLLALYASNHARFRTHANNEFSFHKQNKFYRAALNFFNSNSNRSLSVSMDQSVYGIRPQLVDLRTLDFVNDFMCQRTNNICHVVNAVSPAFTSSFALAKYLVKTLLS